MSLSLHPINPKIPIIIHELHSTTPYIRKYAPKFLNRLKIHDKSNLPLRIRYLKKVLSFDCPNQTWSKSQQEWNDILFKIAKNFRRYCKGTDNLDQKFLSAFYSPEKCQIYNALSIPLYLKIGSFRKLTLEYKLGKEPEIPPKISRMVRNIKRSKLLESLDIVFWRFSHNIVRLFLLELQKYSQIISSLHSLELHYRDSRVGDTKSFSESLLGLKSVIQSVTHFSLNIEASQWFGLNLEDFTKLNSLKLTLKYPYEKDFSMLVVLEALANLETFILETPLYTQYAVENFLKNFRLPKSIKKLTLIRTEGDMDYSSPLSKTLKEDNSSLKEFYERWRDFDQLDDLTLSFQGISQSSDTSDIDFLFMAPILQRCQGLKKLKITTTCFFCQDSTEHSGNLQWTQILQALELFKDALESLEIEACKINFDENEPSSSTFKSLKNLYISIQKMEAKGLAHVSRIVPKTIQKCHFLYTIILHNEQDIQELFKYLAYIPKRFSFTLYIYFPKISPETFEEALLQYLSSAKIEGYLLISIQEMTISLPERLEESIAKALNLNWTGYLEISLRRFGTLYKREKSNILYSLEHEL